MPILPPVIAAYFEAQNQDDPEAFAACFARDAVVRDEGREHRGIDAIKTWHVEVTAKIAFTARPLSVEERGNHIIVTAEISGTFPGSPITLDHDFTVVGGHISTLEIK